MESRTILALLVSSVLLAPPTAAFAQFRPPPPATPAAPRPAPAAGVREERIGPFVYSATLGASVTRGHVIHTDCYWNENDYDDDGTPVDCYSSRESTGTTVTADFRGGLGIVVSRKLIVQSLGYQLHLGVAADGLIHRHELAWGVLAPGAFSGTVFAGASLSSPWEGRGATGLTFGVDSQVWISGPFVVGLHFTADAFEANRTILLGGGAFVGIAG